MSRCAKHDSQQGFLLPIVLMLVMIIALLSFYSLADALSAFRIAANSEKYHDFILRAEARLRFAEKTLENSTHPHCLIAVTSFADLVKKPASFWQSASVCQQGEAYWVIEKLDEVACQHMIGSDKSPQYFRITLRAKNSEKSLENMTIFLQSTWVKAGLDMPHCAGEIREIKTGRQSWREY